MTRVLGYENSCAIHFGSVSQAAPFKSFPCSTKNRVFGACEMSPAPPILCPICVILAEFSATQDEANLQLTLGGLPDYAF